MIFSITRFIKRWLITTSRYIQSSLNKGHSHHFGTEHLQTHENGKKLNSGQLSLLIKFGLFVTFWSLFLIFGQIVSSACLNSLVKKAEKERLSQEKGLIRLEEYRKEINRLKASVLSYKREKKRSAFKNCFAPDIHLFTKTRAFSNEYEVNPYSYFTLKRTYSSTPNLGKRVAERPSEQKQKEIKVILEKSLQVLRKPEHINLTKNSDNYNNEINISHFLEGLASYDPIYGTVYHVYFISPRLENQSQLFYHELTFIRPLMSPLLISNEILSTSSQVIHLIIPLSEERLDSLMIFLENVQRQGIKEEIESQQLRIILSYYGNVKKLKAKVPVKTIYRVINVSNTSSSFSRAKALQVASSIICNLRQASNQECLLFFCDVDIIFTKGFLERCRLQSSKGQKVYFPIVFSFYNSEYSKLNALSFSQESLTTQLYNSISSQFGFWRDFGFGMTCQFGSDFFNVGGFLEYLRMEEEEEKRSNHHKATNISQAESTSKPAWGGEDVLLYRKFIRSSSINVIRSPDPGIFHLWHKKDCHKLKFTNHQQFGSCLNSKALNEASQLQLVQALDNLKTKLNFG